MKSKEYAQALFDLGIKKGANPEGLVEQLLLLMRSRGHLRLLPSVLSDYERIAKDRSQRDGISVKIADEEDQGAALDKARALAESYGVEASNINVSTDDTLIKGYSLDGPSFRYDKSARRNLIEMYRSITKD